MTELNKIYKCNICGNIVQVLHAGSEALVCCNKPMEQLPEQTADAATEKHVPVITKTKTGFEVVVGSIPHPMQEQHYIEWIELIADGRSYRQHLNPGDEAKATFCIKAETVSAREYCNIHGLWRENL
ncbi:MAG: desulfoferrodoxin [Gammaproteobacteria bacterium]|nr:desulfoferrodoxin [Gammaproteobacteria bacterium]